MAEPELMITDFAKFDRPGQLHVGYQALHAYQKKHSRLPKPWSQVSVLRPLPVVPLFCATATLLTRSFGFPGRRR